MIVRCNSCARKNDLVSDAPDAVYEQYGYPHIDLERPFHCQYCGRWHDAGVSVEFVEDEHNDR